MVQQDLPAADMTFPAVRQQAQVDAINGRMPAANIPKANNQSAAIPDASAAQMLPDTAQAAVPQAPVSDQPPSFDETTPVEEQAPKFEDTQPIDETAPKFEDTEPADNSAMKKYVENNIQVFDAQAKEGPQKATSFLESLEAGWQMSTAGLGLRGKMPDVVLPENADRAYRIANQIGTLAGDMPAMALGGFFGGLGGGAAGTIEAPVVGTIAGAAVGGGAGAFALPATLRKIMVDHYEKGDITTAGEFVDRLMATSWEATKGAVTGAATAVTGGAAAVAGPMTKIGAELATMTTVGAAMEGHLPHAQDFIDGAIVIGGLHGTGMVSSKLRNIYAQTGERPEVIAAQANTNPELKQQLLSHDLETPEQSSPSEIKQMEFPMSEGEDAKTETRQTLVKQDLAIQPPTSKIKLEDRSPEEQEVLSKIGVESKPEAKSFNEKFNDFYAKNVDWTDPLKVAYAAFKESSGKELTAEENPHIQSRLFAAHNDFTRRVLNEGVPDENGNFTNVGLNDIYSRVPDNDQMGFDAYSLAKRAIELDDRGIEPWDKFSRENAEKLVSNGGSKFEKLHQERVLFQNQVLDYGVEKGVIDPSIAHLSKQENEEYIPFNRIIPPDELTGGEIGAGKIVQKIEGSDLSLQNPRTSIYENTAAILRRAEINDIRTKTLENFTYENEDGKSVNDFVRRVPVEGGLRKNQIAIFQDGKMYALEGTPLVIDSLKRLEGDPTMASLTTKLAGKFSKALRIGTTANPGFGFNHFFRSSVMSGVYSQTGQIPFVHPLMALGEFMGKESDTYKNWMSDGGATQGFEDLDKNYIANGLEESDAKYPFLNQAWNVIKKPFEATEAFIKMTDNLSRFTEYKRAIEKGESRDQAAFLSREVTPDFAKQGLKRSAMRTLVAFQGAHINSLDRMRQAFAEDTQGTILRMSVLSIASGVLWYANKDDKEIEDLPNYQKDLYWNFNVSKMFDTKNSKDVPYSQQPKDMKEGTIFRLPKPWGPGILFGSGTERTLDALAKDKPEAYKAFGKSLYDSVVPNIIPTMAQPVLEQFANKNIFSGRQLVSNEQQKQLPEMMYQPYTSETAKQLGKLIAAVPAAKDLLGSIGPDNDPLSSPAIIENYIRGWTGIMGGWALKISDGALRKAGITPKNVGVNSPDTPIAEEPIMNAFATRFPSMKEQPIQDFYEKMNKTNEVFNSIRAANKQGDFSHAQMIMAQNQGMELKLSSIGQIISTGRKVINMTQDNPNVGPVQKRQLIDGVLFQIGSAAKMGNQMMDDFQKQMNQSKSKGQE